MVNSLVLLYSLSIVHDNMWPAMRKGTVWDKNQFSVAAKDVLNQTFFKFLFISLSEYTSFQLYLGYVHVVCVSQNICAMSVVQCTYEV